MAAPQLFGSEGPLNDRSLYGILLGRAITLAAALAHGYSLWWNEGRDFEDRKPDLGTIMFYPYLSAIPMHMALIVGGAVARLALPLFIRLKTCSEAGMHLVEHALFRRGAPAEPRGGRRAKA